MAHIPTVDIRQLGDISFDRQLELARQPNRDYDVDRWLFVPTPTPSTGTFWVHGGKSL